jgi:hypothetical protein
MCNKSETFLCVSVIICVLLIILNNVANFIVGTDLKMWQHCSKSQQLTHHLSYHCPF